MLVNVKYGRQQHQLSVCVVNCNGPSLMGRNGLQKITLNWKSLNLASVPDSQTTGSPRDNWKHKVEAVLGAHKNVFQEGLGQINNTFEAALQLKPGAKPKFCKACPVPFALKAAIEGLGQINNTFEAALQLKPGAKPKFCKACPVPFALKAAIEKELDRLESEGILEKVSYSEWAAPVVPVPKAEGTIRLCGD